MTEQHTPDGSHHELPRSADHPHPRRLMMSTLRPFVRVYTRRRYGVRVHHQDRVPRTGPVILAANHVGWLDGPMLAIHSPRPVHALTKREMFEGRMDGFLRRAGQIPVDRFAPDPGAIKTCLRVLRDGGVVGIFPEGARGTGELERFRRGAAYLALVTGAPVVPVSLFGTREPGSGQPLPARQRRTAGGGRLRRSVAGARAALAAAQGRRRRRDGVAADPHAPRPRRRQDHHGARAPRPAARRGQRARRRTTRGHHMTEITTTAEPTGAIPVLAVVGRPNVGKSTLVNRIIGRREAVVEDVPGVTRDRVSYDATWNGRAFTVVDTGGWDPDARGLAERIAGQAEIAVTLADAVLFVVDATVGITDHDEAVVKILRRSGKPVVLAANKVDDQRTEAEALGLWNLGLGEPHAVSALHGRGSGDMLDAILAALPETPPETFGTVGGPRRIAIVGKPNVGKSSLLNKLAGSERVVVDNVAGTTVDPVDELVDLGGRTWRFIDTAGIRKRVKEASGHEYYASLRTSTAIDRAEVAVLVLDGGEPISEQDVRILQTVREAGRALVIAFNKWDLVDEDRQYYLTREIERDLVQVQWAPRINVTARTGWHVDRLVPALDKALAGWETRVTTGALNAFLGRLVAEHPHPVRSGKQPRILFGTQPSTAPPTFVLFTSGKLDASYERFIERRLREEFGFVGTPIVINQKPREKRKR